MSPCWGCCCVYAQVNREKSGLYVRQKKTKLAHFWMYGKAQHAYINILHGLLQTEVLLIWKSMLHLTFQACSPRVSIFSYLLCGDGRCPLQFSPCILETANYLFAANIPEWLSALRTTRLMCFLCSPWLSGKQGLYLKQAAAAEYAWTLEEPVWLISK